MKNIDIIVMGKTGAGKSTLINTVLEEELAPTGTGQAVTRQNKVYSKIMMLPVAADGKGQYGMIDCRLNMYDTVGLEIDDSITNTTLKEIRKHIEEARINMNSDDIHLVWFCVNDRSNRFESYELELIRKLSIDYEIPFIIVLTQCFSNEQGELEIKIKETIPEVPYKRILAKDYKTRAGIMAAFGITELIQSSINDYINLKVKIMEKKLNSIDDRLRERIERIERQGKEIIDKHVSRATKIGFIPGGCIPIVHGICIDLIAQLNKLAGLHMGKDFAGDIFSDVIVGIIVTPFMVVPLASALFAGAYVQAIGENYLETLLSVIGQSSDKELQDEVWMKERLTMELKKLKGNGGTRNV